MKKFLVVFTLALLGGFLGGRLNTVSAQSGPLQIQAVAVTHTSCTVTANITTYCFASDGLWWSSSGAAYVQIGAAAPAGVTSIIVCNAAGSSCGTPQTGAVSISVPKSVTVSAPTATLN